MAGNMNIWQYSPKFPVHGIICNSMTSHFLLLQVWRQLILASLSKNWQVISKPYQHSLEITTHHVQSGSILRSRHWRSRQDVCGGGGTWLSIAVTAPLQNTLIGWQLVDVQRRSAWCWPTCVGDNTFWQQAWKRRKHPWWPQEVVHVDGCKEISTVKQNWLKHIFGISGRE